MISLTTKPSDIDLVAAQCSDAETAASNEVDASQKTEEAGQVDEVEAAMKNEGGVVSENVNDTGKSTLEAVVVENKETAAANDYEVDAPETKAIQEGEMEVTINQEILPDKYLNYAKLSTQDLTFTR